MPVVSWPAAPDGAYWIDVALGNREFPFLIDLGLIDQKQLIGFAIEQRVFDHLRQQGEFSHFFTTDLLDAGGRITRRNNGRTNAQLLSSLTRQRIGPSVALYVARGSPGVPNRVGVAFFHHLTNCRVIWNLDQRTWSIEYP